MKKKNERYQNAGKRMYCLLLFLFLIPCQSLLAQSIVIKGTVIDSNDGTSLVGVSVKEKGTSNGISTDSHGNFSLKVNNANATLMFNYIGYKGQEIALEGRNSVSVKLGADTKGLDEVVVIGYGTQRKGDVTSAIASVKSEDFTKGAVKDAASLIQGKVAGLNVTTSSGDPTQNTQIQLRGIPTVTASTSPLVLIDGIPGELNTVAPEDIESIDVLKDGSAAAIYGTRGTNGVIIITTKQIHGDLRPTINYDGYTSVQTIAKRPDFLTAADYREKIKEGINFTDYGATTDWFKEITRTPVSQNHNLSLQGGNATSNYTASLNYRKWQGMFLNSDNEQLNSRISINHSMFNNKLKFNLNGITRTQKYWTGSDDRSFNSYVYRQAVIRNPTDSVRTATGDWKERDVYFYDNPVAYLMESNGEARVRETRLNGSVTATPIEGLTLKLLVSGNNRNRLQGYTETKQHVSTTKNGLNGVAALRTANMEDNLAEFTTDYAKTFNKHHFSILGGYSYQNTVNDDSYMRNWDFPTDLYTWNNMATGLALGRGEAVMTSNAYSSKLIGFFGRLNYNFDDKYLVMATIRREGSSKFGADHKWGTFPGVSLGWRVTKEPFMKNVTFVNDLKLRAGFGVTGTAPADPYQSLTSLSYGDKYLDNGVWLGGLAPVRNPNPDLRWEKKEEYNLGLDFALFNNRITGSLDAYKRVTKDILYNYEVPVPPYLFSRILANVGQMQNKGLELLLNFNAVQTTNFKWTTGITAALNRNKLVSLSNDLFQTTSDYFDTGYTGEPVQESTHRVQVGQPIGNFFGYKSIDIDADGHWIIEGADGKPKPIADATLDDKKILGNGIPRYTASWNNTFKYKQFDLTVSMRGAFGFQLLNFQRMFYENPKVTQYNMLKSAFDKVYGKTVLNNDLAYVSYYIENGNYVKIDNITLGYTFPIKNNKYIKNARIYASGLNTFTFTKYKGIDPEVSSNSTNNDLDFGDDQRDKYPTTRTFTFGVNLNF